MTIMCSTIDRLQPDTEMNETEFLPSRDEVWLTTRKSLLINLVLESPFQIFYCVDELVVKAYFEVRNNQIANTFIRKHLRVIWQVDVRKWNYLGVCLREK